MNSLVLGLNKAAALLIADASAALSPMLGSFWTLMLLSLAIGAVFAFFYGKISNQARIKRIKDAISANIHEAVLFRHDPVLTIRAQLMLLWSGFSYLSTALIPICILLVPSVVLFTALEASFGFANSPLRESYLVISTQEGRSPFDYSVKAEPAESVSPPLRVEKSGELVYKIKSPPTALSIAHAKDGVWNISELLVNGAPSVIAASWTESLILGAQSRPQLGIARVSLEKTGGLMSALGATLPWYIWSLASILLGGYGAARILRIAF